MAQPPLPHHQGREDGGGESRGGVGGGANYETEPRIKLN